MIGAIALTDRRRIAEPARNVCSLGLTTTRKRLTTSPKLAVTTRNRHHAFASRILIQNTLTFSSITLFRDEGRPMASDGKWMPGESGALVVHAVCVAVCVVPDCCHLNASTLAIQSALWILILIAGSQPVAWTGQAFPYLLHRTGHNPTDSYRHSSNKREWDSVRVCVHVTRRALSPSVHDVGSITGAKF